MKAIKRCLTLKDCHYNNLAFGLSINFYFIVICKVYKLFKVYLWQIFIGVGVGVGVGGGDGDGSEVESDSELVCGLMIENKKA